MLVWVIVCMKERKGETEREEMPNQLMCVCTMWQTERGEKRGETGGLFILGCVCMCV